MRRGFGRLHFPGHRSTRAEPSPDEAAEVPASIDLDLAPLGPPLLMPRAIFRQVLFDATELVPTWAMPRAEPVEATPRNELKATKRPPRPKATKTSAATAATAKAPAAKRANANAPAAKPATTSPRSRTRKRAV